MKVLLINSVCGVGSTGRICTALADILTNQGHECKIAYGRGNVPEVYHKYAVRIGSDIDVKIHGIGTRLFDHHGFYSKQATRTFIKWVEAYNPDVIHLHNIHGYYINVEILFDYLKTCGKKIIWTLHDCWAVTGHCAHFSFVKCDQWRSGCQSCVQMKQYPKCVFHGDVSRNYQRKKALFCDIPNLTVVTPSRWLAEIVKESYLSEYHIKVIYNGIDSSVFKPVESDFREKYGIPDGVNIVLGVAFDWGERKGFDVLLELAKKLGNQYQLVLVGTNDVLDRQIPPNIISIHRTGSREELAKIYTAADVFVNPTREDNYPTVNMESIACGTPVVTFNAGGSSEMLDELCGSAVSEGDIEQLEREIVRVCTEKPYLTENCLRKARSYSANEKFLAYVELYQAAPGQW